MPGWHENLYDPTAADTICDHIIYDAYRVEIEGEPMWKRNTIIDLLRCMAAAMHNL